MAAEERGLLQAGGGEPVRSVTILEGDPDGEHLRVEVSDHDVRFISRMLSGSTGQTTRLKDRLWIVTDRERLLEALATAALAAPESGPRRLCPTHPDIDYRHEWGCPQCVTELRDEVETLASRSSTPGGRTVLEASQ